MLKVLELMEFKNIVIAIPLLTFLVGIVGLLSNLGYRSILSSYPIFLEKNIKITSSFALLSVVIIIILLNSLKKVTITYKEEEGPLHSIKCYWISSIDDTPTALSP